jgi:hypothetical protein
MCENVRSFVTSEKETINYKFWKGKKELPLLFRREWGDKSP